MKRLTIKFAGFWALMAFNVGVIGIALHWWFIQGEPWDWLRDGLLIGWALFMNAAIFISNRKKKS